MITEGCATVYQGCEITGYSAFWDNKITDRKPNFYMTVQLETL